MKVNLKKLYVWCLLVVFATSFSCFIISRSMNLLLVIMISISPIVYLLGIKVQKKDKYFFLLLMILAVVNLIYLDCFRPSSFVYSICFVTSYLVIRSGIKKCSISLSNAIGFIKVIIISYFTVLLLQQMCVLLGLPVINGMALNPDNKWKLNSLSPEPSHTALFMFWSYYGYIKLRERKTRKPFINSLSKSDAYVTMAYLWVMLTCGSTTALFLVFIPFLRYLKSNIIILLLVVPALLVIMPKLLIRSSSLERLVRIVPTLLSFDATGIDAVDHSAAFRFLPLFSFVENFNLSDLQTWIGHGMDAGKNLFNEYIYLISGDATYTQGVDGVDVGGMLAFIVDYGLLAFLALCASVKTTIVQTKDVLLSAIWCVLSIFNGFNIQIFWFSLIVLTLVSFYNNVDYDNNSHL